MGLFGTNLSESLLSVGIKARQAAARQAYQGQRRAAKVAGSQRSIGSPKTHAASKRKRQVL